MQSHTRCAILQDAQFSNILLRVIPQHYPIEQGVLYAGEYPGDRNPDLAKERLRHLISIGIRSFLDLTAPADRMAPYQECLTELQDEIGVPLIRISLPIRDMDVPDSTETMQTMMEHIRETIATTPAVYIHCWGGIGRTGTVVGCWLRECGYDGKSALDHVQTLYSTHMPKARRMPESPQTPEQKRYIRFWQAGGRSKAE